MPDNLAQDIIPTGQSQNDIITRDIFDIKESQAGNPSNPPKRWKEQFHFKDDGTLWVYINNVWRQINASPSKAWNLQITAFSAGAYTYYTNFRPKLIRATVRYWDAARNPQDAVSHGVWSENMRRYGQDDAPGQNCLELLGANAYPRDYLWYVENYDQSSGYNRATVTVNDLGFSLSVNSNTGVGALVQLEVIG